VNVDDQVVYGIDVPALIKRMKQKEARHDRWQLFMYETRDMEQYQRAEVEGAVRVQWKGARSD
jgi:hypothetical protein